MRGFRAKTGFLCDTHDFTNLFHRHIQHPRFFGGGLVAVFVGALLEIFFTSLYGFRTICDRRSDVRGLMPAIARVIAWRIPQVHR
jgi:hypothetical protein